MMNDILSQIPWIVNVIQFGVMALIVLRIVNVLDHALARAQAPEAIGSTPTPPAPKPGKVAVPPLTPPSPAPVVDEALVSAVKKFEGFSAKAYGDFKQYSIGYGTKATSPDETITEADAEVRLRQELAHAVELVEAFAPAAPKGVKQALADLTYNAGTAWQKAGLGTKIKAGDYEGAKSNLLQYNHAGGEVNAGLTARREAEASWFDKPI